MERLIAAYSRLLAHTDLRFVRYLYREIDWDNRLIAIKGARGVGKTTLLLQHVKLDFADTRKAMYASADHVWFASHSLMDLAEYHYTHGGTHLFLDEIHKYKDWEREVKNIYDTYPGLHLVITGSSMLRLEKSLTADLSRRCRQYTLPGLSFREYLLFEGLAGLPRLSLEELLDSHFQKAGEIAAEIKVLPHFEQYLTKGYYPFYREEGDGYEERLQQVIENVIETEIPYVGRVEYESVYKAKRLLALLAETVPYTLNITHLCNVLDASRNNVLKLLDLMDKAALIRRIDAAAKGEKSLTKPDKILFNNTNLMYVLSPHVDQGTLRETFFASQIGVGHEIIMLSKGDLMVDNTHTFEVGGKNKGFVQVADVKNSYVVSDNIEIGYGNRIPLWLFGLLY